MIGVLIVSHSMLSEAILESGDMVFGNHNNCYALGLKEGIDSFSKDVFNTLDKLFEEYDEIIAIADLKGGTPYNQILKYKLEKQKDNMCIITGFNLPMMAELIISLEYANSALELSQKIIETAKASIELDDDLKEDMDDDMFD